MKRKLRMGMVGGGKDALVGALHRQAACLDGKVELVCGNLSAVENNLFHNIDLKNLGGKE